jgi:putative FmdB family regulatory protein
VTANDDLWPRCDPYTWRMPTYTYRCAKCGAESEAVQSMSDPPLRRCKVCGGALRRTYQSVGIVLKGAGFHRNDYRTKPAKSSGDGDGGEKTETSEKKAETKEKADSKPKTESSSASSDSAGSKKKASSDD